MAAIGVSARTSRLSTATTGSSKSAQGARLSDQRYIIFGAGSAGMGIAVQIRDAMVAADGISRAEANRRFWLIDRDGLMYDKTGEGSDEIMHEWGTARAEFVRPFDEGWHLAGENGNGGKVILLETVKKVKPTVLIGCSTAAGAFTEDVIRAMDEVLTSGERPIVLPLSNPSRLVEAKPADILKWTNGKALVATGSPFGTVEMEIDGVKKSFK